MANRGFVDKKMKPLSSSNKTPLEMLKERYAKGEISKKEYVEMKKEIADVKKNG